MTTWNKMRSITKTTLDVLAANPTRKWRFEQLRTRVEEQMDDSVNEYEIRDAVMRIAARSIVEFEADGTIRVNEANLDAYREQSMAT